MAAETYFVYLDVGKRRVSATLVARRDEDLSSKDLSDNELWIRENKSCGKETLATDLAQMIATLFRGARSDTTELEITVQTILENIELMELDANEPAFEIKKSDIEKILIHKFSEDEIISKKRKAQTYNKHAR